jgi:hypothetical protein
MARVSTPLLSVSLTVCMLVPLCRCTCTAGQSVRADRCHVRQDPAQGRVPPLPPPVVRAQCQTATSAQCVCLCMRTRFGDGLACAYMYLCVCEHVSVARRTGSMLVHV